MSQRTMLAAALALMAGGLLFAGLGVVLGAGLAPVESGQGLGTPWQQVPPAGDRAHRPGFAPGIRPGDGIRRPIPFPSGGAGP